MRIETENKLGFFQALYEDAENKFKDIRDELEQHHKQYKGSKKIDNSSTEASYCRNITFELIESQVNGQIPPPEVSSITYSATNLKLSKIIENTMLNLTNRLPFEKLNDLDERNTYIYGGSVWLIEWDNSITTHNTIGGIKASIIKPTQFIPQPAVFDIRDMEYCFIYFSDTHENLVRKYGVSFEDAEKTENKDDVNSDDTCTVIVCFYRDDQDRVCKFVWADNVILEDIEDYWGRKELKCKSCGKTKALCNCEKPNFVKDTKEYEEIAKPMTFFDGGKIIAPKSVAMKDGEFQFDTIGKRMLTPDGSQAMQDVNGVLVPLTTQTLEPKLVKTKVPFYKPSLFPIVIRKNISVIDSLYGQSDCEFIRDQQQNINKLETRINEKLLNAGVALVKGSKTNVNVSDKIFKDGITVESPDEIAMLKTLDFQVNVQQDTQNSERVYQNAKRILGISDSYQGMPDTTAQSGIAKQQQIMQSGGRLESKLIMKNATYAEIYEIMFQLLLAFADEPRPIAYKDIHGREVSDEFNKYAFLERDKAGEWYYNDEFLFSTSKSTSFERNREMMWQETRNNFTSGAFGNPGEIDTMIFFWQVMEELHYPLASKTLQRLQEQKQMITQQQQQIMAQQQMA